MRSHIFDVAADCLALGFAKLRAHELLRGLGAATPKSQPHNNATILGCSRACCDFGVPLCCLRLSLLRR